MQREAIGSLYTGAKGSGKTFAINFHTRRYQRLLAYDQTGFIEEKGSSRFDTFRGFITRNATEFHQKLEEAEKLGVGYRLALIDEEAKHKDWFERTVKELTKSPGKGARPKHPVGLWMEETAVTYNRRDDPEVKHKPMMDMLRGTRHRRLHIIFGTQRLKDTAKSMRELLDDVWVFQLRDREMAREAALELGDRGLTDQIRMLKNGQFFHRHPSGKLTGPSRIRVETAA